MGDLDIRLLLRLLRDDPDSVIESAQVALEIIQHAKQCEFEVRSTVRGHRLNPIERLASAREIQAVEDRISAWGKPQPKPTIEDAAEPTPDPQETPPATEDEASDTEETDIEDAAA